MERQYDAIVVGAGFAGLYMVHRLRRSGFSVRAFEKGDGVGGTWYWNRYPGARCDSESVYYSYSFDDALEQEWDWTERYPRQPEILAYLNHVADRFDLRRDIQLSTAVEQAHHHAAGNRWHVRTSDGVQWTSRFLITAAGCLTEVNRPAFDGLESFEGDWYHTARWPDEGVDLSGKRVGFVGTGSTGIQAIPQIAKTAAHVTVFQRTANYSLPARNHRLDDEYRSRIKANYPELRRQARESRNGSPNVPPTKSALAVAADERQAAYEAAWEQGHATLLATFTDIGTSIEANETAADFVRSKIRTIVRDPEVAELLSPKDHPIGAKRICIDTEYFEAYNRDNVSLVDVKANPIVEITPKGLRTTTTEHEVDVLVFATGFDAMTGALLAVDIRGRSGLSLRDAWAEGPKTYLGLQTVGFPNLFMITGPGSPSVLSNMPTSIEQHVEWIGDCLDHLAAESIETIEPSQEAQDAWVLHVNETAEKTLHVHANSWYLGANIPGKVRVFMPYIGGVGTYREKCDEIAANGYEGFELRSLEDVAAAA